MPETKPFDSRVFFVVSWAFGLSLIWFRPGPQVLLGADAGLCARLAQELAERPLAQWWRLTLDGQPFFERPLLGFWLEAAMFRLAGTSVDNALRWAHLCASATLLLIGITAWELATRRARMVDGIDGPSLGGFAMVGTVALPGFFRHSQLATLDLPLMMFVALGLWATASLQTSRAPDGDRFPRGAVIVWAAAVTLGFWVSGLSMWVLPIVLLVLTAFERVRPSVAFASLLGGAVGVFVTTSAFDALRDAHGAEPFFRTFLALEGRRVLTDLSWTPLDGSWPALAALPIALGVLAVRKKRAWAWRLSPELVGLGALGWLATAGTSPSAVGGGLLVGAVCALVPQRFERWLAIGLGAVALGWLVVARSTPGSVSIDQRHALALQSAAAPTGSDRRVADCSGDDPLATEQLMGFVWRAQRTPCDTHTPWKWDGVVLQPQP